MSSKSTSVKASEEEVLNESQLLKAIKDLEPQDEKSVEKETKMEALDIPSLDLKSVSDLLESEEVITEKSQKVDMKSNFESLNKNIKVLSGFVESSVQTVTKSLNSSAERDLSFLKVLEGFQKSIDGLTSKIEAYGNQPVLKSALESDLLHKPTQKQGPSAITRAQVDNALKSLAAKTQNLDEKTAYADAASTLSRRGNLSQEMTKAIKDELGV
jgi:hypothetical protein